MDKEDFANMIRLARRAPLANMAEAESVAKLLQRFGEFANNVLESETPEQRNVEKITG